MSNDTKTWTPLPVTDADIEFPGSVMHLMPKFSELPEEFRHNQSSWCKIVSKWFFHGIQTHALKAKDGINKDAALRHLTVIMRSWLPKHEHKTAGVAYLMSLWFHEPKDGTP